MPLTIENLSDGTKKPKAARLDLRDLMQRVIDLSSAAAGKGAELLGIADSGSYFSSTTVEGALQEVGLEAATPRPVAKGGTGAASASGALANLGVVNVGGESVINGATTIANLFPASYKVVDSATPADYNIFLPAGAPVGAVVFFRISQTAAKMYTIYDNGTTMDGIDRRLLWAGESVMLFKTESGWTKVGGQSLPIHGALRRSSAQTLTTAGWQRVLLTEVGQNSKGLSLGFDSANSCFIAPRDGVYEFTASLPVIGITALSETFASFSPALSSSPNQNNTPLSISMRQTGQSRNTHLISGVFKCARGFQFSPCVYVTTGTPALDFSSGVVEITMTFKEVVTW